MPGAVGFDLLLLTRLLVLVVIRILLFTIIRGLPVLVLILILSLAFFHPLVDPVVVE